MGADWDSDPCLALQNPVVLPTARREFLISDTFQLSNCSGDVQSMKVSKKSTAVQYGQSNNAINSNQTCQYTRLEKKRKRTPILGIVYTFGLKKGEIGQVYIN